MDDENYLVTLCELQEAFYYVKNESLDRIPVDVLIAFMRKQFDGECRGSVELLLGCALEELCRDIRFGRDRENELAICPYGIIMTKAGSLIESRFLKIWHLCFRSFPDENEARTHNDEGGV